MRQSWLFVLAVLLLMAIAYSRVAAQRCEVGDMECKNKNCVTLSWKCDGEDDCGDNSDEENCPKKGCSSSEFKCKNDRCIPKEWTCDKADDCGDNSDESTTDGPRCSPSATCPPTDFQCNVTKSCIRKIFVCDGRKDCGNGDESDEAGCAKVEKSKCSENEFECRDLSCISKLWRCNGENDCSDGSDEIGCVKIACPYSHQYRCGYRGRCIYKSWTCNGFPNCMDGDDESDALCNKHNCKATEFRCESGERTCIDASFKCNRRAECSDRSDEKNCNPRDCPAGQFKCVESGHCIVGRYRCDGTRECLDGSDEQNCPATTKATTTTTVMPTTVKKTTKQKMLSTTSKPCGLNYFKCKADGKCVHKSWLCDGEPDCSDGEDESKAVCEGKTCSPQQFACKNGKCILKHLKCDSINQCGDNSDEENCPVKPVKCTPTSFKCGNGSSCVEQSAVCDGKRDCPAGEDEPKQCGVNECQGDKHGCSQNCADMKIGYKCTCKEGFSLAHDNRTCHDVNECTMHGRCSQKCVNLKGSYKCFCFDGYILDGDKRTCRVSGQLPNLIIAMHSDIRQISTDGQHYKRMVRSSNVKGVMALDIDAHAKMIYFADMGNKSIARASFGDTNNVETLVKDVEKPEGIAYDWISKKIYWSSTHPKYNGAIEVSDANGSNRLVLVHSKVDAPRAVAVHPKKRLLFWTDWGKMPRIERVDMDGLQRQVVVTSEHLTWPNGLAVDYVADRIFWTDTRKNYIGSSDLDGSNMAVVAKDIIDPYGLTVFEDFVYWTNFRRNQVFRANKFTGANKYEYNEGFFSPMDVQIYHPLFQKTEPNPCAINNGGCSHLCLPSNMRKGGFSCACPTDIKMWPDGKTCDVVYPTTTRVLTTTQRRLVTSTSAKVSTTGIPSTSSTTNKVNSTTARIIRTTIKSEITTKSRIVVKGCHDNQFVCPSTKECVAQSKVCDGVNDCLNGEDELLNRCNSVDLGKSTDKKKSSNNTPLIAGVIAGIACIILVILIILLIIYKRKRNQSNLSITFHQGDQEMLAVEAIKFNSNGIHKKTHKNFENINYTPACETEDLIKDPGLMNVPDDSSSDNGSTCDETKPVMQHQQSNSSNSLVL